MYQITCGGCYAKHPAPFTMNRPAGIPEYLLLFIHTKAHFIIGDNHFDAEPDQLLLIDKNLPYQYSALGNYYMDDWMHFNCLPEESPSLFPDMLNKPVALGNASRVAFYIRQVLWEYSYAPVEFRDENVDMLMHILMNHVRDAVCGYHEKHFYSPYYARLQEIRLRFQSNPGMEINLEDLCRSLSISPSYFQHLYTKLFGISFRSDMIAMRVEYAKELLTGTDNTVQHIAFLCGYHNEVHFYRQFRNTTGMTPSQYRKNMQILN